MGKWQLIEGKTKGKNAPKKDESPIKPRLYNLKTDIGETTDVSAENPDVVTKMEALVAAMKGDLGVDGVGPGCRPLGKVSKPLPIMDHDGKIRPEMEAGK
jgi:arylsulfatase A